MVNQFVLHSLLFPVRLLISVFLPFLKKIISDTENYLKKTEKELEGKEDDQFLFVKVLKFVFFLHSTTIYFNNR